MSATLKFDFQKRKQLRFSEVNYLIYTKKTQFCIWQLHTEKLELIIWLIWAILLLLLFIIFTQGCPNQLNAVLTRGPALHNIYIHKTSI